MDFKLVQNIGHFIWNFLYLLGALSLFFYGIKLLSEGLHKVSGNVLKNTLKKFADRPINALLTGTIFTSILQSSSFSSIIFVSFANAGLITVLESSALLMGANIGTTLTGWISILANGGIQLTQFALPVLMLGFVGMLHKKINYKNIGEIILGFGLLLLGLKFLNDIFEELSPLLIHISKFLLTDFDMVNRLLYLIIGIIITIFIQSSSATTVLALVLVGHGLPLELMAFLVLGANIGTASTAEILASSSSHLAKKSARFHTMFNVIGVSYFFFLAPIALEILQYTLATDNVVIILAAFHTLFNVFNALFLFGFRKNIIQLGNKTIRNRLSTDTTNLTLSQSGIYTAPDLNVMAAQKEIIQFSTGLRKTILHLKNLFREVDYLKITELKKQIEHEEQLSDDMEMEVSQFLYKISKTDPSPAIQQKINALMSICHHIENIGDLAQEIAISFETRRKMNIYLIPKHRNKLLIYIQYLEEELNYMIINLTSPEKEIEKMNSIHKKNQNFFKKQLKKFMENFGENEQEVKNGVYFKDYLSILSNISLHITKISEISADEL